MKKTALISLGVIGLLTGICFASAGDQDYLHANDEYTFEPPSGDNSPLVYPLVGIKTVPYVDPIHLPEGIELVERTSQLDQFKCSACHTDKLSKNKPSPHSRIELAHGKLAIASCFTCHNEKKRDFLKSSLSNQISINHAAKLCYQCHSSQYKDWTKGAHGKRVGNWTGRRVIYNCTQCHNPHKPGFDKRMPKAIPTIRGVY